MPSAVPAGFATLLRDIKSRIHVAQTRAVFAANAELVRLYWDIGRIIAARQEGEGWGSGVIPRLARELHNELPELKGFSERNIGRMITFYRAYPDPAAILPQAAAKLEASAKAPQPAAQITDSLLWTIPWFHHVNLLEQVKDINARRWYMEQTLANGWSRNILGLMIDAHAHLRQGKAVANFVQRLPAPQSDLARQTLKDPYIFDFLTLTEPFQERELETGLVLCQSQDRLLAEYSCRVFFNMTYLGQVKMSCSGVPYFSQEGGKTEHERGVKYENERSRQATHHPQLAGPPIHADRSG